MDLEVARFKRILGIAPDDLTQDGNLEFILDDVAETICNYCNISKVPQGLQYTAYRMAMDLYRSEAVGEAEGPLGSVSSIKEGDVTTSFHQSVDSGFKNSLLKDYAAQLNRYRKIAW